MDVLTLETVTTNLRDNIEKFKQDLEANSKTLKKSQLKRLLKAIAEYPVEQTVEIDAGIMQQLYYTGTMIKQGHATLNILVAAEQGKEQQGEVNER